MAPTAMGCSVSPKPSRLLTLKCSTMRRLDVSAANVPS